MIGLSSFVLGSPMTDDLTRHFPRLRRLGYGLVEVAYQDPALVHAATVKREADEAGLALAVAGDFTGSGARDISGGTPEQRAAGLDYLLDCVEFAARIGAQVVAGPMYSAVGQARLLSPAARARQWDHAVAGLVKAADRAAGLGVTLGIEPLNRFETDLVNTAAQALRMCDEVGADNIGLSLDTFHMNIEEDSFGGAIALAAGRVVSFQASENTRGTPGSGHVPWSEVFEALRLSGYSGPVIVEAFDAADPVLAAALSLWRPVAPSMARLERDAIAHLARSWRPSDRSATTPQPIQTDKPTDRL